MSEPPMWKKICLASVSQTGACAATNWIDVAKIRLQLQGELAASHEATELQYKGFAHTCRVIVRNEGIAALLTKGLYPSLFRDAVYGGLRLGMYEPCKQLLFGAEDRHHTPLWKKICSGLLTGAIASAIANPSDLIKVRQQGDATGLLWPTVRYTTKYIVKNEGGVAGLWQGVGPTVQRAMLVTAAQLSSYDHIKHAILNSGLMQEGMVLHAIASTAAGFVCAVVTSPVDVVKTRIMTQGIAADGSRRYASGLDCCLQTIRTEGPLGLYKGFIPNWIRIGPHTIIALMVYERLRIFIDMKPM